LLSGKATLNPIASSDVAVLRQRREADSDRLASSAVERSRAA
jgi:hypothetical protein